MTTPTATVEPAEDGFGQIASTVTLEDVELCATGTWNASTGPAPITAEDLHAIVAAAQDPLVDHAPAHPGHFDQRFPALTDGEPALGWVVPERVVERNGTHVLVGRIENVPFRLAEVMRKAWRRRSVEVARRVRGSNGEHPMVLRGVGLLGVQAPAVKGLADVVARYSAAPAGSPVLALHVGEALSADTPDPSPASPSVPEARGDVDSETPAGDPAPAAPPATGGDVPRPRYSDVQLRALLGIEEGRDVSALQAELARTVDHDDPAHAPAAAPATNPNAPGSNSPAATPATRTVADPGPQPPAEPATPAQPEAAVPAPAVEPTSTAPAQPARELVTAASAAPAPPAAPAVPPGVQMVDGGVLAELRAQAELGARAMAELDRQRRDRIVAQALSEGRLTPASAATWRTQLDRNETGTVELLSQLTPSSALPTTEAGSAVDALSAEAADDSVWDSFSHDVLGIPRPAATTPGA